MNSASSIVGQVIHCVYTWLPRTAKNKTKERKKDPRGQKKCVNFSRIVKEQSETNYRTLESFKGSNRLPSTPDGSKVCLHFLPKDYKEQSVFSPQDFSSCNLEVVGYKFLSNEKKISKRSALKKWLRQRTNVVQNENFHLDERSHGTRHELCFREVFKCSPRLAEPGSGLFELASLAICGSRATNSGRPYTTGHYVIRRAGHVTDADTRHQLGIEHHRVAGAILLGKANLE
ncbi:unnamed protein product, partial [Porites evermanni]